MWTCCNRDADGTACRQSLHKFEAQDEEVELSGSHLATLARSSSAASFVDQQPVRARTRSGEDVGEEHESDELSEPDDIQSPSDGDDDTGIFDTPGKVISKKRPGRQQAEVADYHLLPDYSPLLSSLPRNMKLDCPDISVHLLDLSDDPDRLMLHEAELQLASALRLNCRTYLYFKRQIFHAALESLQDGNLLKISETRKIIKGSNAKATGLFRAFNNAGWFQKSNFDRWIVKPNQGPESGGPEWRDYPRNAEGLPDPPMHHYPKSRLGSVPERSRTARAQETNSAEEPAQKVSTPYSATYDSFTPVNRPNGATVESPTVEPTTTNPETGKPSKYVRLRVSYPNFDTIIKAENPPSVPSYPAADPEPNDPTYTTPKARRQPRPGNSGSKPRVTASYPKTWGEASEKDRRMVEMKRRENRSWPEIFSWWEKTGVNTLKDSNCLAVRYSLIKKKFEHIWIEEERQYALQHPEESNGSTAPASEEPAADVPMIDAPTSDVTTDAQQTNDVPVEETASNGTPNHNETAKEAPTTIVEPVTAATEHASKGPSADKDISSNVQAEKEETDKTNAPGTEGAENGVAQAERPAEEATTPSLAT